MLAGELYLASDPELAAMNLQARKQLYLFNLAQPEAEIEQREIILNLFGSIGDEFVVRSPFYCDYGCHIVAGDNLYINYDCTILDRGRRSLASPAFSRRGTSDCNKVHLGNNVLLAPKVQIYTAYHPTDPQLRRSQQELAAPVTIGDNVWLGGGVIVCPGVTIGNNVTVGAGSVVVKDLPDNVVAVGNPCRIIKRV